MNALFELLFSYRPVLFEKGTIVFHPLWPGYVYWGLAACALAGAYWLYRRTNQVLPWLWQAGLMSLRATAFLVLLVILLQPTLVLHSVLPQKTFVAVAYDTSKSMEIQDGPGKLSRMEIVKDLLRPEGNEFLDALAAKFQVRFFGFSMAARRSSGFETPLRLGSVTDLERALSQAVAELGTAPVSGIILMTDGADNHSADLSAAAMKLKARNIPIYPVGIGSADINRDTEVVRVSAPRKVLKDTMVEANVSIRSKGYAGSRAKLVVKERDRVVQNQEIQLGSDGEVRTHKINFSSDTPGPKVFTFRLEPFSNEAISENNDQDALVRVEDEQPVIFYAEGEPRWLYGFLRRAIQEDKNLRLVTLLRQADGKFYRQGIEDASTLEKGFPVDKAELFAYKALILGSVEASFFTFDQLRLVSDFVSQRGGSLMILGGKNALAQGGYVNTPLEDVLPVSIRFDPKGTGVPPYEDIEYKVRLTSYGLVHPVMRLAADVEENRRRWEKVPELVGLNPTAGPKAGATVLATAARPDLRGQSPVLLAFQRFGRGKCMTLTTASVWRWRMQLDHKDNTHEVFWKQMLRWLVSDVPDPVVIQTEKHSYSLEESVLLRAEVNDNTFLQQNNAQVTARVKSPSGEVTSLPLGWDVSREGQYSAAYKPQEEGIYEVSVEASQGAKSLGTGKANFRIGESKEEYHNAALNVDLLKRLASQTGGRYYAPGDVKNLPEDISYVESGASRIEEKDLWDMPFLFLLLVGSVSMEWILRKRKGLA